MKSLKGHSEYVMGMCQLITNKDYITIISGSGDNSIKIWEWNVINIVKKNLRKEWNIVFQNLISPLLI